MKIIDYASLIPGSKRTTAEDRERAKKVFAELSTIAKERNIVFVTAKSQSTDTCGTLHATGLVCSRDLNEHRYHDGFHMAHSRQGKVEWSQGGMFGRFGPLYATVDGVWQTIARTTKDFDALKKEWAGEL